MTNDEAIKLFEQNNHLHLSKFNSDKREAYANDQYPPFLRTSFQRPDITKIKANRENRRKNAYELAKKTL